MLDKLQGYAADRCFQNSREKKEKRRKNGEKKKRERGRAQEGATGQEMKKRTAGLLSFTSENVRKHNSGTVTAANRIRLSEKSCQTVFHTEYSDPLSHRAAVQCTGLQTVLL